MNLVTAAAAPSVLQPIPDCDAHRAPVRQAAAAHEQRQLTEALLTSLTAVTSTLCVEAVIQQILAAVATVVPSEASAIILLEGEQARVAYTRGYTPNAVACFKTYRFTRGMALVPCLFNASQPYLIPDTQSWPAWLALPFCEWIRSSLGVPVTIHGQTLGWLVLDSATPHYFQPTDLAKVAAFAQYAGLALVNPFHTHKGEEKLALQTVERQAAKAQEDVHCAQQTLAEERNLLRTVIDAIPDLIFVKDRAHRFIMRNRVLGFDGDLDPQTCLGKTDFDYFPAATAGAFQAEEEAIFRTGQPLLGQEVQLTGHDGRMIWVTVTKVPLRNQQGEITGLVGILQDITQRRAQQRELRFYAGLQENVSDAVITTDLALQIQSWNRAAESIYGWRADEVIGKNIRQLLRSEYETADGHEQVHQALLHKGFACGEVMQRHRDGRALYILRSLTLLRDEQGVPFGTVSVNYDITGRKETERLLAEERNLLRTVLDTIPHPIYIKDRQHRFTLRNAAPSYHLPEIPAPLWLGKSDQQHWPAELAEKFWAEEEAIFQTGQPLLNQETQVTRPDGTVLWTAATKVPLRNLQGEITGLVGIVHDITAYKTTLAALAASEEKYRHLIGAMGSGFVIYDFHEGITYVNELLCTMLGYSQAELIGTPLLAHVDEANRATVTANIAERRQGKHTTYEMTLKRKDGQPVYCLVAGSPLHDAQGQVIGSFAVLTDHSLQKEAERVLQDALKKQQEVNALRSQFVSMASHEFRTPLTSILLMAETIRTYRQKLTPEQIDHRLLMMRDQIIHLKSIIENTLELTRFQMERVEFQPAFLHLGDLCRMIVDELQPPPDEGARLDYQCTGMIPKAKLDKRLMRQVITNLLTNALKYSPPTKAVIVRLTATATTLVLQVEDQGIGIPEADLPHLFTPFRRASNVGTIQGTGLGLVIAKEAIELHGGTITVTSQSGLGSTFAITIPLPQP